MCTLLMPEVICGVLNEIVLEGAVEFTQHNSFSFIIPPRLFPMV